MSRDSFDEFDARRAYYGPCHEGPFRVTCRRCDGDKVYVKTTIHLATGKTTEEELYCDLCDEEGKVWE